MVHRQLFASIAALAASTSLVTSAEACGGLFCNAAQPVNQAAERIVFAKNSDGTVTAAIEIMYEGPGEDFAWVLPVPPGDTQVGVSSGVALDRLQQQSNPQYQLNVSFDDGCGPRVVGQSASADSTTVAPGTPTAASPAPSIQVVAEGNAGPYDWTQIAVPPELDDPADAAVMWLEDNGYQIDGIGPDALRDYLVEGMDLIAFRLQSGKASGSIRPILLTYEAERPFIPIKPTAVAANDDMSMLIWVLGDSRAIANNYYHLEMNEALINWFSPAATYDDVVIAAADEAGGQGFVTEQSGPAGAFAQTIYNEFEEQMWEQLRTGQFSSLADFFQNAQFSFSGYDGFNDVMTDPEVIPLREGATHEQFLSCISCYFEVNVPVRNEAYPSTPYPGAGEDPIHTVDVPAFLDRFYTFVIEPLEATRKMFEDNAVATRFYTTMSPEEMTVDPDFDFNPELPDIDNQHIAEQRMMCDGDNEWEIELPQGQVVRGDGRNWPVGLDSDMPVNLRVLQLSTSGEGEIETDNAELIASLLTDLDIGDAMPQLADPVNGSASTVVPVEDDGASGSGGCSVATQGQRASTGGNRADLGWLGLLGLPLLFRRRMSRR